MLLVISPFGPETESGNWQTASRYGAMLQQSGIASEVVVGQPSPAQLSRARGALVLHARRGHEAARLLRQAEVPFAVVLTGTDIYGDLVGSAHTEAFAQAQQTLRWARALVGLQADVCEQLKAAGYASCQTITQTTPAHHTLAPIWQPGTPLRAVLVGHVREVKSPLLAIDAFLQAFQSDALRDTPALLTHIGGSRDDELMQRCLERVASSEGRFRMRGRLTHPETLAQMAQSHLLIHPSRAEGGPLVLAEASGMHLATLASDIAAHRGMLGVDYPGLFDPNPQALLAALMRFVREENFRSSLRAEMGRAALTLTDTMAERSALAALAHALVQRPQ